MHIMKTLECGPVPPNWSVQPNARYNAKTGGKKQIQTVRYIETTKGAKSWEHPNSEVRRRELPVILDEFRDEREEKTGIYHPPLPTFKVGNLDFHYHDSWEAALAAAFFATAFCLWLRIIVNLSSG